MAVAQHDTGRAGAADRAAEVVGRQPCLGADTRLIERPRATAAQHVRRDDRIVRADQSRQPVHQPRVDVQHARAREAGEEWLAAQCLAIADTPVEGVEVTTKANGDVEEKRGDMLGHRKLQIDTRLKLLAKWNPKKWGDKIESTHLGPNGGPVQVQNLTDADLERIAASGGR